jgi:pimeloyl-ACP methyl ester carboxylesterase
MQELADRFRMVAIDLRGYNRSDKPSGVDQYAMPLLVSDIVAVIRQLAVEINMSPKAVIVGHDWGGTVTRSVAMMRLDLG